MDIFGSDSEEDNAFDAGGSSLAANQLEVYLSAAFLALMKLKPHLRRSARPARFHQEEGAAAGTDVKELLLPRVVAIVISAELEGAAALANFLQRLASAGFVRVQVNPSGDTFDAVLHYEPYTSFQAAKEVSTRYATDAYGCHLVAGGCLLLPCPASASAACFSEDLWLSATACGCMSALASTPAPDTENSLSEAAAASTTMNTTMLARRRGVCVNATAAVHWASPAEGPKLSAERALLAAVTIYSSVAEQEQRVLGDESHRAAVAALRVHGLVVFPGIFDKEQVGAWGKAALGDFEEALLRLQSSRNLDLLNPGSNSTRIENFRELGMREALRCDIRNGSRMKRLAAAEATAEAEAGKDAARRCRHLRNHPALQSVLSEVANPPAVDPGAARGNWGRWNFEGAGPDAPPPPLNVNQVGAVMSLPGCVDQTIHADTAHLYLHVKEHMPPAYFNLFVPSVLPHRLDGSPLVGQTAFVAGTHILSASAKVMCEAGGQALLESSLLRPHIMAGDALIFDCRILHFGLANRTKPYAPLETAAAKTANHIATTAAASGTASAAAAAIASSLWERDVEAACRALLYINYTQPWFVDPKNWNDNDSLFQGQMEGEEAGGSVDFKAAGERSDFIPHTPPAVGSPFAVLSEEGAGAGAGAGTCTEEVRKEGRESPNTIESPSGKLRRLSFNSAERRRPSKPEPKTQAA